MANKFCNPCGLPRHVYYRVVKFDGFYRDVRRNVVGCSQVCGVSFGVACWRAGMRISETKPQTSD
jgi:hypothetical protein